MYKATIDSHHLALAQAWRDDIPLYATPQKNIIYLDNAATLLKTQRMVDSLMEYYTDYPANIHRGNYEISRKASKKYEDARTSIKAFFNADETYELVFTSGMTEGSNSIAHAHRTMLSKKDTVLSTVFEHHSSSLPWRECCKITGSTYKEIAMIQNGEHAGHLDIEALMKEIPHARVLSIVGMSNVTGYEPPLEAIMKVCKKNDCIMIVDACQLAVHRNIDLQKTPFDVLLCSAHKLGGPTGIGAMCIKKSLLDTFSQVFTGGGTVVSVRSDTIEYCDGVERFEAGTPHIAGAIGFATAVAYIEKKGWDFIEAYEKTMRAYVLEAVQKLHNVKILGGVNISTSPIVSFTSDIHASDLSFFLDQNHICTREGKLCAEPLLTAYGCKEVTRVSAFCYNTIKEIGILGEVFEKANSIFH